MANMLFTCGGMRQGKHHLYDYGAAEQNDAFASVAQGSFKQTIHKRIQEPFGATKSKAKLEMPTEFDDDIRDEDFDVE